MTTKKYILTVPSNGNYFVGLNINGHPRLWTLIDDTNLPPARLTKMEGKNLIKQFKSRKENKLEYKLITVEEYLIKSIIE